MKERGVFLLISKEKGSLIAKNGFKNEKDIVIRFNNWRGNELAQSCLCTMGCNLNEIKSVTAIKNKKL